MSEFVNKPGFGVLFDNPEATGNQPRKRGSLTTPDGQVWEIAGWERDGKRGTYLSLKAQTPLPRGASEEPF